MFILIFIIAIIYIMIGLIIFEIVNVFSLSKKNLDEQLNIVILWPGAIILLIGYGIIKSFEMMFKEEE